MSVAKKKKAVRKVVRAVHVAALWRAIGPSARERLLQPGALKVLRREIVKYSEETLGFSRRQAMRIGKVTVEAILDPEGW